MKVLFLENVYFGTCCKCWIYLSFSFHLKSQKKTTWYQSEKASLQRTQNNFGSKKIYFKRFAHFEEQLSDLILCIRFLKSGRSYSVLCVKVPFQHPGTAFSSCAVSALLQDFSHFRWQEGFQSQTPYSGLDLCNAVKSRDFLFNLTC